MTGIELLMALKEADYLDHLQLSFRLGYTTEAITVWLTPGDGTTVLDLLGFSAVFDTIDHH